jgi:hypothetical protein
LTAGGKLCFESEIKKFKLDAINLKFSQTTKNLLWMFLTPFIKEIISVKREKHLQKINHKKCTLKIYAYFDFKPK